MLMQTRMQVGRDVIEAKENSMSRNMALLNNQFCRGEDGGFAGLPQLPNQILMGDYANAQLPKSVLDLFMDPTNSSGITTSLGRLNANLEREEEEICKVKLPWTGTNQQTLYTYASFYTIRLHSNVNSIPRSTFIRLMFCEWMCIAFLNRMLSCR